MVRAMLEGADRPSATSAAIGCDDAGAQNFRSSFSLPGADGRPYFLSRPQGWRKTTIDGSSERRANPYQLVGDEGRTASVKPQASSTAVKPGTIMLGRLSNILRMHLERRLIIKPHPVIFIRLSRREVTLPTLQCKKLSSRCWNGFALLWVKTIFELSGIIIVERRICFFVH
jgi:hypothetical protein